MIPIGGVYTKARRSVRTFVLAAAIPLVGFAVLAPLRLTVHNPLPGQQTKFIILNLLGAAVALLGVAEMALVKAALQAEPARGGAADFVHFLELRGVLQRILAVEGTILGAAILVTGALRNAVNAYPGQLRAHPGFLHHHPSQKDFLHASYPHEYLLLYGAYLTLLLALFYAPVYLRLLEAGQRRARMIVLGREGRPEGLVDGLPGAELLRYGGGAAVAAVGHQVSSLPAGGEGHQVGEVGIVVSCSGSSQKGRRTSWS